MAFLRRLFWSSDRAADPSQLKLSRLPRGWLLLLLAVAAWMVVLLIWVFASAVLSQPPMAR